MKTKLTCHCGQWIRMSDVLEQSEYNAKNEESYIYLKFRCFSCKKMGEHFIKLDEWDDILLNDATGSQS